MDEEQRFGVAQKERLKEKFRAVDVLTPVGHPHPEPLNMAMSGLRDMSVIEEAPMDRHPVQTYVCEYDSGIIADAIRRAPPRRAGILSSQPAWTTSDGWPLSLKERVPGQKSESPTEDE